MDGWLDSITDSMDVCLSKLREIVKDREAWPAAVREITESGMTKQLNNNRHLLSTSCWENKDKSDNDAVFLGG